MSTRHPPVHPGDAIGVWTALRCVEDDPRTPPSRARWLWRCRCGREHVRAVCTVRASASRMSACATCAGEANRKDYHRREWTRDGRLRLRRGNVEALDALDAGELVAVTVHDVDDLPGP